MDAVRTPIVGIALALVILIGEGVGFARIASRHHHHHHQHWSQRQAPWEQIRIRCDGHTDRDGWIAR